MTDDNRIIEYGVAMGENMLVNGEYDVVRFDEEQLDA